MPESSQLLVKTHATLESYNKLVRDAYRLLTVSGGSKTIASGAITVTPGSGHGAYTVDTEGAAASDDLATISGGSVGDIIVLWATSTSRTVKLVTGGNINVHGRIYLSPNTPCALYFNGSTWIVLIAPERRIMAFPIWTSTENLLVEDPMGGFVLPVPPDLHNWRVVDLWGFVDTPGSGETFVLKKNGTSILSVNMTIDSGETGSHTAATAAAINTSLNTLAQGDKLRFQCAVSGGALGFVGYVAVMP